MNKRIITIIIALATVCDGAWAQPKKSTCPIPGNRGVGKMTVVDTTRIRVWYAFNADNVKDVNTYIDQQRLDIGKRLTKIYSDFLFCSDSLLAAWSKSHPCARTVPNPFTMSNGGKKEGMWSEYEYSDLFISNGKLTEYAIMPMNLDRECCQYTEPVPKQQWTLKDEQQNIHGYRCQKATCHWRGRDYVSWFTSEIPIQRGPWKFGGLPGLIVKISDAKKEYNFELVRLERTPRPIMQWNFSRFKKVKRLDMLKLQKKINVNWLTVLYGGRVTSLEGNTFPDKPYSPMELE